MFSKIRTITLAAAAVAAVGAATLVTSTSADARGVGGFGGGGLRGASMHVGGGAHVGGHVNFRPNLGRVTSFRPGLRPIHRPGILPIHRPGIKIGHRWPRPHFCRFHWHRWCGIHVRWPRPVIEVGVGTVAATSYAVAPSVASTPAPSCTCLTKQYTPDGLVVFQDVCTKEVASAPIGNTQVQLQVPAPTQQQ